MKVTTREIISELQEKFPELTQEELSDIVYSCWGFFKEHMECGILTRIRVKYFGTFIVSKPRVDAMIKSMNTRLAKGLMTQKDYDSYIVVLNNYLDKLKKDWENED